MTTIGATICIDSNNEGESRLVEQIARNGVMPAMVWLKSDHPNEHETPVLYLRGDRYVGEAAIRAVMMSAA